MIECSLIIPIFNKENIIEYVLNSVVNNHGIEDEKFECILVNESSTDNSKDICIDFANMFNYFRYVEILNDGVNRPSNARNFGLSIARGKYVMFLDADDYLSDDKFIQKGIEFLNIHPEYNMYIGTLYIFNQTKKYYEHMYLEFDSTLTYGPILSCCIIAADIAKKYKFENTCNEDIIYTRKIIADKNIKYYYNDLNPTSHFYNTQYSDMVIYDDNTDNWFRKCVEYLQYYNFYDYRLNSQNIDVEKSESPILNIDYHLIDKCNLNCAHCNHFCPLVPKDTVEKSFEKIKEDLQSLERFKDYFTRLTLLGGEPTLHSNLNEILNYVRNLFPNNEIMIITNGTTYKNLYKWKDTIIKNHILVHLSIYPIPNKEKIIEEYKFYIPTELLIIDDFPSKYGFTHKLLMNNENNNDKQILNCMKRTGCVSLLDNKLYICHYGAYLNYLKEYFKDEFININNDDAYIELNDTTTINDIMNFLLNSIPNVCRHCNDVTQYNTNENFKYLDTKPWKVSNCELSEFYV